MRTEALLYDEEPLSTPVYKPSQAMVWLTDEKRDHVDTTEEDVLGPCPSIETLLARSLNIKTMTRDEEYNLFAEFKSTDDPELKAQIREEFLCRNLRLVMKLAKDKARKGNYQPKDLIAWGVMGMIRAFEKFDLSYKAKFSTYAIPWIKQAMVRGLAEVERTIRTPYNILTDQSKLAKFEREFSMKTGVEAEDIDICAHFHWSQQKLDYIRQGLNPVSSIDVAATDDGEDTVADLLVDESASTEEEAFASLQHEAVMETINSALDEREADVIMNLYGFYGINSLSKDELAQKYNVSPERILQIREESISKMRHPSKSRRIRVYRNA